MELGETKMVCDSLQEARDRAAQARLATLAGYSKAEAAYADAWDKAAEDFKKAMLDWGWTFLLPPTLAGWIDIAKMLNAINVGMVLVGARSWAGSATPLVEASRDVLKAKQADDVAVDLIVRLGEELSDCLSRSVAGPGQNRPTP